MNELRVFLAIIIFFISSSLIYDLVVSDFDWIVLITGLIGFTSVHFIWPKNSKNESAWYDMLEVVIDLPYRAMALLIRSLGKAFKNTDVDLDF